MRAPSTDAGALARCAAFQTLRPQASPVPLRDETTAYWRCWDARKQTSRCAGNGRSFICWLSAEHRFLMSRPSCLCGLRGCPGRAARETSVRSESGLDQMQRVCSRANGIGLNHLWKIPRENCGQFPVHRAVICRFSAVHGCSFPRWCALDILLFRRINTVLRALTRLFHKI